VKLSAAQISSSATCGESQSFVTLASFLVSPAAAAATAMATAGFSSSCQGGGAAGIPVLRTTDLETTVGSGLTALRMNRTPGGASSSVLSRVCWTDSVTWSRLRQIIEYPLCVGMSWARRTTSAATVAVSAPGGTHME
jgi:hypothetical protein